MRMTSKRVAAAILSAAVGAALVQAPNAIAAPAPTSTPSTSAGARDVASQAQAILDRSVEFLKSQQKPDGGWQNEKDPPAATEIQD